MHVLLVLMIHSFSVSAQTLTYEKIYFTII